MVPTSCQVLLLVLYLDPKNSYMQPPSTVQEGSGGQTTCCDAYSLIQMMSVWLQITVVWRCRYLYYRPHNIDWLIHAEVEPSEKHLQPCRVQNWNNQGARTENLCTYYSRSSVLYHCKSTRVTSTIFIGCLSGLSVTTICKESYLLLTVQWGAIHSWHFYSNHATKELSTGRCVYKIRETPNLTRNADL